MQGTGPCKLFLRDFFLSCQKTLLPPHFFGLAQRNGCGAPKKSPPLTAAGTQPLQPFPAAAAPDRGARHGAAATTERGKRPARPEGGRAQPPPEQNSARPPQRARQGAEIKSWGARGESKQPTGAAHSDAEGARSDRAVITAGCRQTTGGYHVRGIPYFGGAENAAVNPFVSGYDYV